MAAGVQASPVAKGKPSSVDIDTHKLGYLNAVLKKANDLLKEDRLKDAAAKYYEIKFLYELMDSDSKLVLFNEVASLADKIIYRHVQHLLEKSIVELATNNIDAAIVLYGEIEDEYNKLSEGYKNKVYPRCCELALHLKGYSGEQQN